MKVEITVGLDTKSGEYEMKFNNKSDPGGSMDYHLIMKMLSLVFKDFSSQVEESKEMPEGVYQNEH